MKFRIVFIIIVGMLFIGCAKTYTIQIHPPIEKESKSKYKQIVLFLDGTRNNRDSRTNVSTLNEIIKHQNKDNLYMFYNEGVGTGGRMVGAGTGLGIGRDVVEAYAFLSEHYSKESKLYIFGFSRGAYTSRILAGMIYSVGGIYNLNNFKEKDRLKISEELYSTYKGNIFDSYSSNNEEGKKILDVKNKANKIIKKWKKELSNSTHIELHENVKIDVMGLWDTVEALGVIPTIEAVNEKIFKERDPQNIVNPNLRYLDQICNIKHVYHALSLDDNRANVFTPIIISSEHVVSKCNSVEESSIGKVEEVWFSGAHSDVGGGYSKNEYNKDDKDKATDKDVSISGISLNWMMSKIKDHAPDLLPENASVFENYLGYVHDARNGEKKYKLVLRNNILTKDYKKYSRYDKQDNNGRAKLRIHDSVFKRLSMTSTEREQMGFESKWYEEKEFKDCFEVNKDNGSYLFVECDAITKVENNK